MIGMMVILAVTNLSWFAAFFLLATRKKREGNVCTISPSSR